ncbi:RNA-binding protein [Candidatus Woesearchaeota archaeon]|nr:RNA-binding protein [Candidatus Woesearchaeota archaeon]
MESKLVCISCKKLLSNNSGIARFLCPQCGKSEIVRCAHCRKIAAKYVCPQCNFEGPN